MEPEDLHASGERLREPRHQQRVGRPGEDEAPRGPLSVDLCLERGEDFGDALNFVKDRPGRQARNEADRIGLRGRQNGIVVE